MLSPLQSGIILVSGFLVIFLANRFHVHVWKPSLSKRDKTWLVMNNTMGTILIVVGILKLLNLKKFKHYFLKYDVISQVVPAYSYVYPFLEVALGASLLLQYKLVATNLITIVLMVVSMVSVTLSILQGQTLRCGCLGSFLHVPLSYVTITENVVMAAMSVGSLAIH